MTNKNVIPAMTDPMGKNWSQPPVSNIAIDNNYALMTNDDYSELPIYNFGMPSGVYPGKMWAGNSLRVKYLFWFGEDVDGNCSINSREVIIV